MSEDLELCGGKVDICLTHPYLPAQKIDDEPREFQSLVRVPSVHAPPAQVGPDAAHQLRGADRLDDVVVGANLEPNDDVSLAVVARRARRSVRCSSS